MGVLLPFSDGTMRRHIAVRFLKARTMSGWADCRRNGFKIAKSSVLKYRFACFRTTREVSGCVQAHTAGESPESSRFAARAKLRVPLLCC